MAEYLLYVEPSVGNAYDVCFKANIFHVAVSNQDVDILAMLIKSKMFEKKNLVAVNSIGLSPIDMCNLHDFTKGKVDALEDM